MLVFDIGRVTADLDRAGGHEAYAMKSVTVVPC
jgi:hypothetical protein